MDIVYMTGSHRTVPDAIGRVLIERHIAREAAPPPRRGRPRKPPAVLQLFDGAPKPQPPPPDDA